MNETCTHNAYGAIIVACLRNIHNKNFISHLTIIKDFLRANFFLFQVKKKKERELWEGFLLIFLWRDGENKNWWSCFTVINQTAETIIYSYPLGNIHCRWTYFLKIFFIKLFLIILPLFAMYPKWKKYQYNYLSTFLILPSVINQSWTPTQCLSELISYFYIEKKNY